MARLCAFEEMARLCAFTILNVEAAWLGTSSQSVRRRSPRARAFFLGDEPTFQLDRQADAPHLLKGATHQVITRFNKQPSSSPRVQASRGRTVGQAAPEPSRLEHVAADVPRLAHLRLCIRRARA